MVHPDGTVLQCLLKRERAPPLGSGDALKGTSIDIDAGRRENLRSIFGPFEKRAGAAWARRRPKSTVSRAEHGRGSVGVVRRGRPRRGRLADARPREHQPQAPHRIRAD